MSAGAGERAWTAAGPADRPLLWLTLALVAFGLLMVYSSSSVLSLVNFERSHAYLESQAVKAAVGLAAMAALARLDYHVWPRIAGPLLWASLGLLALTVVPGTERIAPEIQGARRWIALPGFSFQPSEVVKIACVLWIASTVVARTEALDRFATGPLPLCAPPAAAAGMLVLQPDFGSALFLALVVAATLFLGGVRLRHLAALAASAVPLFVWLAVSEPYRLRRLLAFRDPEKYLDSLSYQVHQSLISLGSGGLLGVGIGSSRQKFLFLPEAHTDFIFAIVGEELGFLGAGLVLLAFVLLARAGARIARRAPDDLGLVLGGGLTALLVLGGLFNIGVATGNLPTTGLTLPFLSYGATSLTVSLAAVGILLNVSRPRRAADRVLPARRPRASGGAAPARPLLPSAAALRSPAARAGARRARGSRPRPAGSSDRGGVAARIP
ncbi:MAG TPA: putative lipid II flippase FtsW [Gemmatimonadota bacterium]